jgi:hypothetical protein
MATAMAATTVVALAVFLRVTPRPAVLETSHADELPAGASV